ncbi:hypothetical protein [Brevifollis gellanilyticus]|uniref:hypothetical protein n=1 Tax=Brevifollis gellanilyticus TaxID=748831 RepID=UPI001C3F9D4E|nr:hypothetical protein [Brevifollis gellanilyticus]
MVALAGVFTLAVVALGYVLLGWVPMVLFAFGFVGGFVLWLRVPSSVPFGAIRAPYFIMMAFFAAHKFEERHFGFFPALSKITGVQAPEAGLPLGLLLYAFAMAWLLIPFLVARRHPFGYFLAWTFFTSMGVTELAHFVFPFFTPPPLEYFPGMATVVTLAPAGWWGMSRLYQGSLLKLKS